MRTSSTRANVVSVTRVELNALPPVPFLHDAAAKNVIVIPGGSFSGIVDVDDLCFGDPRYVVALTRASLLAFGGPTRYVDACPRGDIWQQALDHLIRTGFATRNRGIRVGMRNYCCLGLK
jgi:hypothetical protein